jgi:fructose-1,6-bisphosphatase I
MQQITILLKNGFIEIADLLKFGNQINLGTENPNLKNKSGDLVKQLDLLSHNIIVKQIEKSYNIVGYISEEHPEVVFSNKKTLENFDSLEDFSEEKYIIAFDPLDGSSNIDSNITTGTIFALYKYDIEDNSLTDIVCAGYCLYGPATILVMTDNNKNVNMFQLNKDNEFIFLNKIDFKGNDKKINRKIYSVNESHFNYFDLDTKQLIIKFKEQKYNHRYIGSMVSDCHRTLIQGGVFMYPGNKHKPRGKIRLLYEALPFAKIFSIANGFAYDILYQPILDNNKKISLDDIHIPTPIILSSRKL